MLLLVTATLAHYTLTVPASRGHDDLAELTGPCAGYNLTTRAPFPISGAIVTLTSYHNQASLQYFIATTSNPVAADFVKNFAPNAQLTVAGAFSTPMIDFTKVGAVVGQSATLQTVFTNSDGVLYQCADIIFTAASGSSVAATSTASVHKVVGLSLALLTLVIVNLI